MQRHAIEVVDGLGVDRIVGARLRTPRIDAKQASDAEIVGAIIAIGALMDIRMDRTFELCQRVEPIRGGG